MCGLNYRPGAPVAEGGPVGLSDGGTGACTDYPFKIKCYGNRGASILMHLDASALTSGISFAISKRR